MCSTCGATCDCSKPKNNEEPTVSNLSDNNQTIFQKMDTSLTQRLNNRLGCSLWLTLLAVIVIGYLAFQIGQASTAKGTSIGVGGFFIGTVRPDDQGKLPVLPSTPQVAPITPAEVPSDELGAEPSTEISALSTSTPTLAQFVQLQIGMSFDDTVRILGAPTNVLRTYTPRSAETGSDFTWYRWGGPQTQITLLFKNGALYVKEQKGLL